MPLPATATAPAQQTVWSAGPPLSEMTWFRDWDYFISSFRSMRVAMELHGLAPLWNPHFCGGRPELANPQNWAYTWLHPLVFLAEPVHLILAAWVVMTLAGLTATAALVAGWTGDRVSGLAAGAIYALSGYFGAHFNQGTFTFAFMHLVPVLLWLLERRRTTPTPANGLAVAAVSLMFATSALPHGLFYAYPAVILYLLVTLAGAARRGPGVIRATLVSLGVPHLLGMAAGAYKLLPVVAWQWLFPRQGVGSESMSLGDILLNTLRVDTDYDDMLARAFDRQVWFLWEYNAHVGWLPWLCLALALMPLIPRGRPAAGSPQPSAAAPVQGETRPPEPRLALTLAGVLVLSGLLLATGNQEPWSPGTWFRHLPLVGGIRVYGRFQFLLVLGLAVGAGCGIAALTQWLRRPLLRRTLPLVLAAATAVPLLIQLRHHVGSVRGLTPDTLAALYPLQPSPQPQLVRMRGNFLASGVTHQDHIVRAHHLVANCYDPLNLARPPALALPDMLAAPLTSPAPDAVTWRTSGFDLHYNAATPGPIALLMTQGAPPVTVTPTPSPDENGIPAVDKRPDAALTVRIEAKTPGLAAGLAVTLAALAMMIVWQVLELRSWRGRRPSGA